MPLSKRHINKVLNVKGYAFVNPHEAPNLTQRYTESYIRRRLFALEDETVITIYGMYQKAYRDIGRVAHDTADELGIRQLENTPAGINWRRRVIGYAEAILHDLALDVAKLAYDKVTLGYLASYYGKAWMLDSMTVDDVINIPRVSATDASLAVMDKQLLEDVGNQIIYDNLGQEWREVYGNELDDVILKIRRRFTTGMGNGDDIRTLMHGVADILGVTIDRRRTGIPDVRANFNRVQSITRSYFIDANNRAALGLYQANADIIGKSQWLTAQDGRVCPQCQGLEGQTWDIFDLGMKHPVTDTHPLCRCSLIPVLRDDVDDTPILTVPDDQLPSTSFTDWLIDLGLGYLLQDFIGTEIDSTRI